MRGRGGQSEAERCTRDTGIPTETTRSPGDTTRPPGTTQAAATATATHTQTHAYPKTRAVPPPWRTTNGVEPVHATGALFYALLPPPTRRNLSRTFPEPRTFPASYLIRNTKGFPFHSGTGRTLFAAVGATGRYLRISAARETCSAPVPFLSARFVTLDRCLTARSRDVFVPKSLLE